MRIGLYIENELYGIRNWSAVPRKGDRVMIDEDSEGEG